MWAPGTTPADPQEQKENPMRERFQERWRDKTRDNLTSALNSLGVRAKMAERGRAEEEV